MSIGIIAHWLIMWAGASLVVYGIGYIICNGGLQRFFKALVDTLIKAWDILARGYSRKEVESCKIQHQIAKSEYTYYGSVQSESVIDHVNTCHRHQDIFKPKRVPPKGPGGSGGTSRSSDAAAIEAIVKQVHQQNQVINRLQDEIDKQRMMPGSYHVYRLDGSSIRVSTPTRNEK